MDALDTENRSVVEKLVKFEKKIEDKQKQHEPEG